MDVIVAKAPLNGIVAFSGMNYIVVVSRLNYIPTILTIDIVSRASSQEDITLFSSIYFVRLESIYDVTNWKITYIEFTSFF